MADIIIVGAGPAGLSAAIYALRAGKSVQVFEAQSYGGQIINTLDIENYPGIKHISGFDFATGLYEQAAELGAELIYEQVTAVEDRGDKKIVHTEGKEYECGAVILATGAKNRALGLIREKELIGRGISYCATCDGAFFRGKDVAVNGGGNTALEDAAFLSNYCNKVYVIHRRDAFRADARDVELIRSKPNIELVLNATVTGLIGQEKLESIEVTDKFSGEKRMINVSGLFIAIGQAPENTPFENVVDLDEGGYIIANESCVTRTSGIFTAGDCRTKTVRQLTTAAADGAVAALAAAASLT